MTCGQGHEYQGDENARARKGWCPFCGREAQRRYKQTDKGRAAVVRYEQSEKAAERRARYQQSPKGWQEALRHRRRKALQRRANRVTE